MSLLSTSRTSLNTPTQVAEHLADHLQIHDKLNGYVDPQADFGATGNGVADDTGEIQDALDAGLLRVPRGEYLISSALTVTTQDDVTVILHPDATIRTNNDSEDVFSVTDSARFGLFGGHLEGVGKASATVDSVGVRLNNSPNARIEGVEMSGLYHGIRPDIDSGFGTFAFNNLHDLTFVGIFPHTGDVVVFNRMADIGTSSLHHGLYMTDGPVAGGVVCLGNTYNSIAGSAVHAFSTSDAQYGMTFLGETFLDCYGGYYLGEFDCHNFSISGAVIKGCTDRGIVLGGNAYDGFVQATIEGSTGRSLDVGPGGVITTRPTDIDFNIVATGGAGCYLTSSDYMAGWFKVRSSTGDGVRLSGATYCDVVVHARGCWGDGLRLSASAVRNLLRVQATGNTGYGVDFFPAGVNNNTVIGQAIGNTAGQLNDSGTDNTTAGLRTT